MSDEKKATATTAQQRDDEQLPDLTASDSEAVKGGLNFTKIEYKYTPTAG
ncbi:MAG: hypothetical protein ACJ8AO_04975 [Gemmatimonadaceae bacterium]|jgi:hypothetical protein